MDVQQYSTEECKARLMSIGDALYVIGGKWKMRIIVALMVGSRRFNDLQRMVEGISARVLSTELKALELNGFVRRQISAGPPVMVDYELTPYAATLHQVLDSLVDWGAMHRETVRKSMRKAKGGR